MRKRDVKPGYYVVENLNECKPRTKVIGFVGEGDSHWLGKNLVLWLPGSDFSTPIGRKYYRFICRVPDFDVLIKIDNKRKVKKRK